MSSRRKLVSLTSLHLAKRCCYAHKIMSNAFDWQPISGKVYPVLLYYCENYACLCACTVCFKCHLEKLFRTFYRKPLLVQRGLVWNNHFKQAPECIFLWFWHWHHRKRSVRLGFIGIILQQSNGRQLTKIASAYTTHCAKIPSQKFSSLSDIMYVYFNSDAWCLKWLLNHGQTIDFYRSAI